MAPDRQHPSREHSEPKTDSERNKERRAQGTAQLSPYFYSEERGDFIESPTGVIFSPGFRRLPNGYAPNFEPEGGSPLREGFYAWTPDMGFDLEWPPA